MNAPDTYAPEFTRRELNRALLGCVVLCASLGAITLLAIMANYQSSMERAAFLDSIFNASVWPLALPGLLASFVVVATIRDIWLYRTSLVDRILLSLLVGITHVVAATIYWMWILRRLLKRRQS